MPIQIFSNNVLTAFGVKEEIIRSMARNFRIFYSAYILYGVMIMTMTFFQAIGEGKKAASLVLLRYVILFVPAILILPIFFGNLAVYWTTPLIDIIIIGVGLVMQKKEISKMNLKVKSEN